MTGEISSKDKKQGAPVRKGRKLVVVSGYYGFDNLGDEAILEEIINEVSRLAAKDEIVVLSNMPAHHMRLFGVRAIDRWSLRSLVSHLLRARLFISGGGGLFQEVNSPGSTIFYGLQILLARLLNVPVLFYAQGIGPFKSAVGKNMTRLAAGASNFVCVRDEESKRQLSDWGIRAELTQDPVWALEPSPLPGEVESQIASISEECSGRLIGLSLRETPVFSQAQLESLSEALLKSFDEKTCLLLLPLQRQMDVRPLNYVQNVWAAAGRKAVMLDATALTLPSQWISLMARLDLVVAMRLHAAIMALKSGVPVAGVAYDPKVERVLRLFEQPILNLTKEIEPEDRQKIWIETLKAALADVESLSERARHQAESAKKLACQNFQLIAKISGMQSDPLKVEEQSSP